MVKTDYPVFCEGKQFSKEGFIKITSDKNLKYDFFLCEFRNINFSKEYKVSSFRSCKFYNCTFDSFNGKEINAARSKFENCKFNSSDFSKSDFESTGFIYCEFSNSNLSNSKYVWAELYGATFKNSDLSAVNFSAAKLDTVIIRNCFVKEPVRGLYRDNIILGGVDVVPEAAIVKYQNEILSALKVEENGTPIKPNHRSMDYVR